MLAIGVPSHITWLFVVLEDVSVKVGSDTTSIVPDAVAGLQPPPVVNTYSYTVEAAVATAEAGIAAPAIVTLLFVVIMVNPGGKPLW